MVAALGEGEARLEVDAGVVVMGISIGKEKKRKNERARVVLRERSADRKHAREVNAAAEQQPEREQGSARGRQRNLRLANRGQQIRVRGVWLLNPVCKLVGCR